MGASRLLVRVTERMRPCCRSLFDEEMMSCWLVSASDDRALLTRTPSCCSAPRFDMGKRCGRSTRHRGD